MTNQVTRISCNLCHETFLSTDDLIDQRLKKHEDWHGKNSYLTKSRNMIRGKVEWRYEN